MTKAKLAITSGKVIPKGTIEINVGACDKSKCVRASMRDNM